MARGIPLRRWGCALVAVLICGTAGCSGDAPSPSPTTASVQPAETATPTVTVTKPALPLGKPTEDSAVAFVKYFIAASNYAYATYDTSLLEEISQPTCKYCGSAIDDVKRLQATQIRVGGSELSLVVAALPQKKITDSAIVAVVTDQRPGTSRTSTGQVVKVPGSRHAQLTFALDWDGGRWMTAGVSIEKKGAPWHA